MEFVPGQSEAEIIVQIFEDDEPEPNEDFEIILASPKGGLTLGFPHKGNTYNTCLSFNTMLKHLNSY